MLTILLIGMGVILVAIAILGFSSRGSKKSAEVPGRVPSEMAASGDFSMDKDRKRATGPGDN